MNKHINNIGKIYYRPWGTYQTLCQDEGYQTKIIFIEPKGKLSLQKHFRRSEHLIVVSGRPTITVNDIVKECSMGDYIHIPLEAIHRLENFTPNIVKIIEVQIGDYLGEDDILRLDDIYHRKN